MAPGAGTESHRHSGYRKEDEFIDVSTFTKPAEPEGATLHLDGHSVGVGAKGRSGGTGVGDRVGAGFTDVDLGCWDVKLSAGDLRAQKTKNIAATKIIHSKRLIKHVTVIILTVMDLIKE